ASLAGGVNLQPRLPPATTTSHMRLPGASDVELHPLGERQPGRIVHRARLPAHVALPGVGAALPSASGLLLAAEGAADLGSRRTDVDVGDAAIGAGCSK